jgi:hypothetical protein
MLKKIFNINHVKKVLYLDCVQRLRKKTSTCGADTAHPPARKTLFFHQESLLHLLNDGGSETLLTHDKAVRNIKI